MIIVFEANSIQRFSDDVLIQSPYSTMIYKMFQTTRTRDASATPYVIQV